MGAMISRLSRMFAKFTITAPEVTTSDYVVLYLCDIVVFSSKTPIDLHRSLLASLFLNQISLMTTLSSHWPKSKKNVPGVFYDKAVKHAPSMFV